MANKNGSSNLPAGPLDLGAGSSYGMDTLIPLSLRNEGPLDHARLPESKGISRLPEGILVDPETTGSDLPDGVNDAEHIVMGSFDAELVGEEYPRLTDLSWLENAEQDPSRLPHTPHSIPELVEEWGVGRRTDGTHFFNDLHTPSVKKTLPVLNIQDLARAAMRNIAIGHDATEQLNQLPQNIRQVLASEINLNGKVYIRAEAYPKCDSGKWTEAVRKQASSAEYLIQKSACAGCTRNNQGTCGIFQKRLVAEVPWDAAYNKYASRLKTAGYKVPSTQNPKNDLKVAFASGPQISQKETYFPTVSDTKITLEEASKALRGLQKEAEVLSKSAKELSIRRIALQQKLEKWVDGRYLTLSQMRTLLASKADPQAIMRVASHVADANMIQKSNYTNPEGIQSVSTLTHDEAWDMLKQAESQTSTESQKIKNTVIAKTREHINKLASGGLLTQKEAQGLINNPSLKEALTKLKVIVSSKLASKTVVQSPRVKISNYSGEGVQKVVPEASPEQVHKELINKASLDSDRNSNVKLYIHSKQASAAHSYIKQLKDAGVISEKDIKSLDLTAPTASLLDKLASIINSNNLGKKSYEYTPSTVANYSGEGLDALYGDVSEPSSEEALAQLSGSQRKFFASPNEIRGVLKWASDQMHEGSAGKELDTLLSTRFSPELLKAASPLLSLERTKHEGLAGHLYIDAAHYASQTGTTGCEKGASQHRANAVKAVLAMSRCGSCVFKNANSTCQKYNKQLVGKPPVDDPAEYQKQIIHLANASDQENTQALFTENNIIAEFQLERNSSENIEFSDDLEYQPLEGVVFGDFDLE